MRIAIYARKSTESEDRQVQSLEDQIRELTTIADREGIRVAEIFQEARSAKAPHTRPEFERLIAAIEAGTIDGVLTWSISRLSRNPVDGGVIAYLLQSGRLEFIRTAERTYRPEDNALLLSIENGMATAYLQDLSRNVKRGMKGRVERGWLAGKAPVGYKNDLETQEIVPDQERFDLVRKGFDLLLSGNYSVSEAHRILVELGLTIRSRNRKYGPISITRYHLLVHERFYVGEIRFRGQWHPGKHTPMLTEDEFQCIQENLLKRSKGKHPPKKTFAFGGSFRCDRCGCMIVGERKRKHYPRTGNTAIYTYYHCSGAKGCSKKAVTEENLYNAIAPRFLGLSISESTAGWIKDSLLEELEKGVCTTASNVSQIEQNRQIDETRLRRLSFMKMDGEVSAAEYNSLRDELLTRIDSFRDTANKTRQEASRLYGMIAGRIDLARKAGEIRRDQRDEFGLGQIMEQAGIQTLTLDPFGFQLDPIIEKITTVEPLRDGSEKPKRGDLLPLNSIWLRFVNELLTTATDQITQENCLKTTPPQISCE